MRSQPPDSDIQARLLAAKLPAMPQLLLQLMELCRSDEVGMSELAGLIAKDPAMVARVLGVANSSAYRRHSAIVSLEQSLMTVGMDMVKTLLISESVFHLFGSFSQSENPELGAFWRHSLTAAMIGRMIAETVEYPHVEEAYLAALLHDVGRLALLAAAPQAYTSYFYAVDDETLSSAEKRTLDVTHAEAGAWIAEKWQLDSFIADSIRYHHEPATRIEAAPPLIRIVSLAHHLAEYPHAEERTRAIADLCGVSADDLEKMQSRASTEVEKTARHMGIVLPEPGALAQRPPPRLLPDDPVKEQLGLHLQSIVLASQIDRSFAAAQELKPLVQAISESACLLFDLDAATILLLEPETQRLVLAPAQDLPTHLVGFGIPMEGAIADAVAGKRLSYLNSGDARLTVPEEQLFRIMRAGSLICLPVADKGECRGVLIGATDAQGIEELKKREGMLQVFGAQAGMALGRLNENKAGDVESELVALAAEYRRASKEIAHEVNNPLSIIRNYLTVLDRKLAKKEPVGPEIAILQDEIDRVAELVSNFADRPAARETESADIDSVVDSVVRLLRQSEYGNASVKLSARPFGKRLETACDTGALKQIILNLVKNALEALPDGGEVEVVSNGLVNRGGSLFAEVLVRDTGAGIPDAVMAKLFSPVKSSKGSGHRGIGLSIVHGLVQQAEGQISCRSSPQGTTFELLLPLLNRSETARAASPPDSARL